MAVAAPATLSPDLASPAQVAQWLARRQVGSDVVTGALVDRFRATIGSVRSGDPDVAPPGLHWCLAPEVAEAEDLGPDGLPLLGGLIPPLRHLTARMWAGATVTFVKPLRLGDQVRRVARLAGLTEKAGRSGRLVFGRFDYDYQVNGETCIAETQIIAFRNPAATVSPHTAAAPAEPELWEFSRTFEPSAATLFRFSALTFNSHRIHYDERYATQVEGHRGLLVHGTLTAALLLTLCADHAGDRVIQSIHLTAVGPSYCGDRLTLAGRRDRCGLVLAATDPASSVVMHGSATLRENG